MPTKTSLLEDANPNLYKPLNNPKKPKTLKTTLKLSNLKSNPKKYQTIEILLN
jgi:hypothetical protein